MTHPKAPALEQQLREGCPTYSDNMSNGTPGRILADGFAATNLMNEAADELARLRERVAVLEGALAKIAIYHRGGGVMQGTPEYDRDTMIGIARKALENRND